MLRHTRGTMGRHHLTHTLCSLDHYNLPRLVMCRVGVSKHRNTFTNNNTNNLKIFKLFKYNSKANSISFFEYWAHTFDEPFVVHSFIYFFPSLLIPQLIYFSCVQFANIEILHVKVRAMLFALLNKQIICFSLKC